MVHTFTGAERHIVVTGKSYTRVTLALDIIRKIEVGAYQGYHELAIIKHQIDLYDTIVIEPAHAMQIICENPHVPCDSTNLCWKAVALLQKEYSIDKQVKIHLHKSIPVMGGLAGGSANAATTLQLLDQMWDLGLGTETLMNLGRKLGMDVPFYFIGETAFDSEAGGCLQSIPTSLGLTFVLAIPDFGISTREAYQGIDYAEAGQQRAKTEDMKRSFLHDSMEGVIQNMHNDFEHTVFMKQPKLEVIKQELLDYGCLQAGMSGSGSTVIGVVRSIDEAERIKSKANFQVLIASSLKL